MVLERRMREIRTASVTRGSRCSPYSTVIRGSNSASRQVLLPYQFRRVEARAVDAHALIIVAVGRLHLRHATEADAHAARHRRFERHLTRYVPLGGKFRQRVEHWLRTAADQRTDRAVRF